MKKGDIKILLYLILIITLSTCSKNPIMEIPFDQNSVIKSASSTIAVQTFYVDSVSGSDSNSGLSDSDPWKSLEKVSSTVFQPGDHILFKAGSQWTGKLEPKGSGNISNPIRISSYGSGAKPILMPGADWQDTFSMNGSTLSNQNVNSVISLYNQQYWEIDGLELYDPKFSDINPSSTTTYRRGIYIRAQDVGALKYFKITNMYIHGFRGPNTNYGKVAGGIVFHTTFNPSSPSLRQPTWFEDIEIANNHIENVGRTGIKFHSVWCTRQPDGVKWPNVDFYGIGNWTPNVGIYIHNNMINNIDGDGIIVRDCKDSIVEHNIIYGAAANCGFAVGIFNWNSDNTIIQFNEVYDTKNAGDAQGIEIDALNDYTRVQYNYVHDNAGGFIMWCNTSTLPSYDGDYRYNISQNDRTSHGLISWCDNHHGSDVYNNVIYSGPGISRDFMKMLIPSSVVTTANFYNNIFYNTDTMNVNWYENKLNYDSNIYYGFSSTPVEDINTITSDPLFSNPGSGTYGFNSLDGYRLTNGSPAINSGLNITDNGGRDFFGNTLYIGSPDRGIHEFNNDPGSPPNPIPNLDPEISQSAWSLVYVDSQETTGEDGAAVNAFDNDEISFWHTEWSSSTTNHPHEIQIDLGNNYDISSFTYVSRSGLNINGSIKDYEFYVSNNTTNWGNPVASGTFTYQTFGEHKTITFSPKEGRYIRLRSLGEANGNPWTSCSELKVNGNLSSSPVLSELSKNNWSLVYVDSEEISGENGSATNLFDNNPSTIWHTEWSSSTITHPHEIIIDLGATYDIGGVNYHPRQDLGAGKWNGTIKDYEIYISSNTSAWDTAAASGTLTYSASSQEQSIRFTPQNGRYIKLRAISEVNGNSFTSGSELDVLAYQ